MSNSLPDGISRLIISSGRIYVQASQTAIKKGVGIVAAGTPAQLEPLSDEKIEHISRNITYRPTRTSRTELEHTDTPTGGTTVKLNALSDWAIPNTETLQVRFAKAKQPERLRLAAKIHIPAHKNPFQFHAYLATHRARGNLVVTRHSENDVSEIAQFPFSEEFEGGTQTASYDHVNCTILPSNRPSVLVFELENDGTAALEDTDGYFFFADPHVTRHIPAGEAPDMVEIRATSVPVGELSWVGTPDRIELTAGQKFALQVGSKPTEIPLGADNEIRILEDHGHTLNVCAKTPGNFLVRIGEDTKFRTFISDQMTSIRYPVSSLRGGFQDIRFYDESGTVCYLRSAVLIPRILTPQSVLKNESRPPFFGPLDVQASSRYQGLKAQMQAGAQDAEQIAYALSVLEGGYKHVKLKPIHFPTVENPKVSIVIPAYNKVEVTYFALCSLLLAYNKASFEVILVDDASTDETAEIEDIVSGITVVRNETSQRFIRACNAGAAKARGEFVVLLNNDVEVTSGWLDALLDGFDRFDNVGMVGSRLIYPDGRLQDAGGIIWKSGNPWNYGHNANPSEPKYCYARQVDYLSGAALMLPKSIWDEVGGLSSYLEPMYFEDTDLSFKVRDHGYKTWYIPSSVVYHYEGMTSGKSTSGGFKRYQEVNRPKFKQRWASAYSTHGKEGFQPDLEKDRGVCGRVLFIDAMIPRADQDAGSYAAIKEMQLVQSLGYKVTLLPMNLAHMGKYVDELQAMGIEVIYAPFFLSVNEFLRKHSADFDAFYITRYYVARDVMGLLRETAPNRPILFNNADLHFLRELRAAQSAGGDQALLEAARQTKDMELAVIRDADVTLSYNETEHSVIDSHLEGQAKVARCPWVVDVPDTVPPIDGRKGISFLGNYRHLPNAEGVEWFLREVMPMVSTKHPDLVFSIYGSAMTDEIKAYASDTVDTAGFVEEVADAYNQHRIFVAPLLSGAGIKGKVLAALTYGIPCVLTPVAAEGIGLRHKHDCLIAQTPQEWFDAIDTLQRDDALWQSISDNARAYVTDAFSFERGRQLMREAFESVELYSPVE